GVAPAAVDVVVVGVVGDTKQFEMRDAATPYAYFAYPQVGGIFGSLTVRTLVEPMSLADAVRKTVWGLDSEQPVWKVRDLASLIQRDRDTPRSLAALVGGFAGLALLLTVLGTYGVVSYFVTQRTREFGIRLALGAQPRDLLRLVLRQGVVLAVIGGV